MNAGRPVGVDKVTGQPTSVYTVIVRPDNSLVTAFPGLPTKPSRYGGLKQTHVESVQPPKTQALPPP